MAELFLNLPIRASQDVRRAEDYVATVTPDYKDSSDSPIAAALGRRRAHQFFVVVGTTAQRRVDDQVDLAVLHQIDHVGPTLVDLEHVGDAKTHSTRDIIRKLQG